LRRVSSLSHSFFRQLRSFMRVTLAHSLGASRAQYPVFPFRTSTYYSLDFPNGLPFAVLSYDGLIHVRNSAPNRPVLASSFPFCGFPDAARNDRCRSAEVSPCASLIFPRSRTLRRSPPVSRFTICRENLHFHAPLHHTRHRGCSGHVLDLSNQTLIRDLVPLSPLPINPLHLIPCGTLYDLSRRRFKLSVWVDGKITFPSPRACFQTFDFLAFLATFIRILVTHP